jgi:hypothetical protein
VEKQLKNLHLKLNPNTMLVIVQGNANIRGARLVLHQELFLNPTNKNPNRKVQKPLYVLFAAMRLKVI